MITTFASAYEIDPEARHAADRVRRRCWENAFRLSLLALDRDRDDASVVDARLLAFRQRMQNLAFFADKGWRDASGDGG